VFVRPVGAVSEGLVRSNTEVRKDDLPIVRWYFGLKFRNFNGGLVRQLKSSRGSI